MKKIHQLSDIDIALKPYLAECVTTEGSVVTTSEGAVVVVSHPLFHEYDFRLTLSSGKLRGYGATVTVGRKDGEYYGCVPLENGMLRVVADDHRLPPGRLWAQLMVYFPDELHPDGYRTVVSEWDTGQTIVTEGPCESAETAQVLLSVPKRETTTPGEVTVKGRARHDGFVTPGTISCFAEEGRVYRNRRNTMRLPINRHLKKTFDISFIPGWEECELMNRLEEESPEDYHIKVTQEGSVITIEYLTENGSTNLKEWCREWYDNSNIANTGHYKLWLNLPEAFIYARYISIINGKLVPINEYLDETLSPPTRSEIIRCLDEWAGGKYPRQFEAQYRGRCWRYGDPFYKWVKKYKMRREKPLRARGIWRIRRVEKYGRRSNHTWGKGRTSRWVYFMVINNKSRVKVWG